MHKDLPDVWYTYVPNMATLEMLVDKLKECCVRDPFEITKRPIRTSNFPCFLGSNRQYPNNVAVYYGDRGDYSGMVGRELNLRNIFELEIDEEKDKKEEESHEENCGCCERCSCLECGQSEFIKKIKKLLKKNADEKTKIEEDKIKEIFNNDFSHIDFFMPSFSDYMTMLENITEKFKSSLPGSDISSFRVAEIIQPFVVDSIENHFDKKNKYKFGRLVFPSLRDWVSNLGKFKE